MLNKKGQAEDNVEMIAVPILLVLGFVLITLFNSAYFLSIDQVKSSLTFDGEVHAFDAQFMGTDLINLMKLPVNERTLGEMLSDLPKTGESRCDQELRDSINTYLLNSYGTKWLITVHQDGSQIFDCAGFEVALITPFNTNLTIPSNDPSTTLLVRLEAFE